jgi:hypothetical protein
MPARRLRPLLPTAIVLAAAACAQPPATTSHVPGAWLPRPTSRTVVLAAGEAESVSGTPVRVWVDEIAAGDDATRDTSVRVITEVAGTGARTDRLWVGGGRRVDAFAFAGYAIRLAGVEPSGSEPRAVIAITPEAAGSSSSMAIRDDIRRGSPVQ